MKLFEKVYLSSEYKTAIENIFNYFDEEYGVDPKVFFLEGRKLALRDDTDEAINILKDIGAGDETAIYEDAAENFDTYVEFYYNLPFDTALGYIVTILNNEDLLDEDTRFTVADLYELDYEEGVFQLPEEKYTNPKAWYKNEN